MGIIINLCEHSLFCLMPYFICHPPISYFIFECKKRQQPQQKHGGSSPSIPFPHTYITICLKSLAGMHAYIRDLKDIYTVSCLFPAKQIPMFLRLLLALLFRFDHWFCLMIIGPMFYANHKGKATSIYLTPTLMLVRVCLLSCSIGLGSITRCKSLPSFIN